jgi:hypothetical protein
MKPTRDQNFKKLQILVEQLHKHCEKAGIEYYLCHEAPQHQVLVAGRSSEQLMTNIACDLALNHQGAVLKAREIVARVTAPQKPKEESKIITLR